jgi:hypothetical protein
MVGALIPLVYAGTEGAQPLTVVIPTFASQFSSNHSLQVDAGLLAVLPRWFLSWCCGGIFWPA